jgi:RNA polymerase sigma factor (sigma-70 family)|tara:strand:- start:1967 stop:2725 length:759 start_codon:yes stop_codon:yes gene_type:complete
MKKYHVQNYVRYKHDVAAAIKKLPNKPYEYLSREQLVTKFLPLVEKLARRFSTSQQASGVMSIMDIIQEGNLGLCAGVDRIEWDTVLEAENKEKRLKSFLAKRIKGAIRRGIDTNRGSMRIPEHKLNEIRKDFGEDKRMVSLFFNSVFTSLDAGTPEQQALAYNIPDKIKDYNIEMLSAYLKSLMLNYLNPKEYQVLRLSYGLDCKKHSAKEIADILGIKGTSSYVRISQLKKLAIDKLIEKVPYSQVVDYL